MTLSQDGGRKRMRVLLSTHSRKGDRVDIIDPFSILDGQTHVTGVVRSRPRRDRRPRPSSTTRRRHRPNSNARCEIAPPITGHPAKAVADASLPCRATLDRVAPGIAVSLAVGTEGGRLDGDAGEPVVRLSVRRSRHESMPSTPARRAR